MFDIGFWEILLILVLALVVLGPERLPQAARSVGYWVGKARRYVEGVKHQVETEFDSTELKRLLHNQEVQIKELQNKMTDTGRSISGAYTDALDAADDPEVHHDQAEYEPQYEIIEEDDEPEISDSSVASTDDPSVKKPVDSHKEKVND